MNTSPSIDQMLEGVIMSIGTDLLPSLVGAKAQANAQMMQSVLQGIRQLLPVYDQVLAEEHNEMLRVLRDASAAIGGVPGAAADRIRDRAATLGRTDELPVPLPRERVMAAHRALGCALQSTMVDVDEMQRAGESDADAALQIMRCHLAPRVMCNVQTFLVGDALLGRG